MIEKSPEQREKIKGLLLKSFLFKALEEKDLSTIISAMERKAFK